MRKKSVESRNLPKLGRSIPAGYFIKSAEASNPSAKLNKLVHNIFFLQKNVLIRDMIFANTG